MTDGMRFVPRKKRIGYKISSFVTARTNLIPSNSLIQAEGEMVFDGSKSVSYLTNHPAYCTGSRRESKGVQLWHTR